MGLGAEGASKCFPVGKFSAEMVEQKAKMLTVLVGKLIPECHFSCKLFSIRKCILSRHSGTSRILSKISISAPTQYFLKN